MWLPWSCRFKTEVSSHSKAPAGLPSLQGNLQERFDRVNRKLKNWELVETAATEVCKLTGV